MLKTRTGGARWSRASKSSISPITSLAKYAHHFEGADAVVSLARRPRLDDPIETYDVEDPNIRLNYNVMRAAYEAGCERFVYASSNHAADWYERYLIHERKMENLDPYKIPLSDNFYGWSKASSEHMGFLFASGAFGRKMGFVGVRIGSPSEVHSDRFKGDVRNLKRHLGSYISPRDITQLFSKAIDATDIENEHGIPWQIVYGISDNTRAYWSLSNARQVLGYPAGRRLRDQVRRLRSRVHRGGQRDRAGRRVAAPE